MEPDQLRKIITLKGSIRECHRCHLGDRANPVPHSGLLDQSRPSYAIVGEAPGPDEDKQGKPFVGAAGKFLRSELKVVARETKCPVDNTVFLNTVNCYPGAWDGNGIRKPTSKESEACRPWLIEQLEVVAPDFVLCLGGTALNYWWNKRKISESRGRWWLTPKSLSMTTSSPTSRLFISTYHPSAILRDKGNVMFKQFRHDLATFYEVGAMMWTARKFGVEQTSGAELEWLEEEERGTGSVGRGRGRGRTPPASSFYGSLFDKEDQDAAGGD